MLCCKDKLQQRKQQCTPFVPTRLPSNPPCRCPGVYGRGCGGNLRLVRWTEGSYFFACSVRQGMSSQCGFKGREAAQHAPLTAHAVG